MAGLALFGCLLGATSIATADTSACRVSAEVIPNVAVVGQQILYRVRILRRQDVDKISWERGLSFPNFRAEWLPGRTEAAPLHDRGMSFVAREEDRALFPLHAGSFEIPEASLRCVIRGRGSNAPYSEILRVGPIPVRIVEPPAAGRPDDFGGAVGPLSVQTSIDSRQIRLGESLAVSILVRGAANLWDLPSPIHGGDFDAGDTEFFHKQPSLDLEAGERLYLRRYFRFDLVPHKAGTLTIPAVRIPYYDPRTGRYEVAKAEAVRLSVLARNAADTGPSEAARATGPASPADPHGSVLPTAAAADSPSGGTAGKRHVDTGFTRLQWAAVAGVFVSGLAVALSVLGLRGRRRHAATRNALAEADQARTAGDWKREYAALSRALYGALAVAAPDLDAPSPGELRERAAASEDRALVAAADAIDALDRARFSPEPDAADDGDARAAIAALQARARRHGAS